MRYSPSAEEIGDIRIDHAAHPQTRGISLHVELDTLNLPPRVRTVPLPEPVTWRDLNGRQPEAWEEPLIVAARERERRLELALLAGLVQP